MKKAVPKRKGTIRIMPIMRKIRLAKPKRGSTLMAAKKKHLKRHVGKKATAEI